MSDEETPIETPEPVETPKKRKPGRPRRALMAPRPPTTFAPPRRSALAETPEPSPEPPPPPPPAPAGIAPTAEQWAQMMAVLAGNKEADMEVAATIHARAMKKALRPENEVAPDISVYNPLGERDNPRKRPSHIFMQGPYPICSPQDYHTSTATEIALCEALVPGDYMVTKADGNEVKVTIKTDLESNGTKPYRTTIIMPMADDDQKSNWVPLVQMLTQITTGEQPAASYARMQAIIDRQAAELAALKASAA